MEARLNLGQQDGGGGAPNLQEDVYGPLSGQVRAQRELL